MRHPEGTELLCTNCGRDTTAAAPQRAATAAPSQAAEAQPASHQERLANGTGSSAGASSGDDEPGLVQPPPPLRERLQAEVAAPAAAAPSVPAPSTAAAPHHAGTSSGAAWLRQAAASSGSGAAQQAAQHARPLPARAPPQPRAGGQASQGGQGEASKAIAELMLEGWALLQEHCPRCASSLLGCLAAAARALCPAPRRLQQCWRVQKRLTAPPCAQVPEPAAALARPPAHLLRRLPDVCCARGRAVGRPASGGGDGERAAKRGSAAAQRKQPRSGCAPDSSSGAGSPACCPARSAPPAPAPACGGCRSVSRGGAPGGPDHGAAGCGAQRSRRGGAPASG